MYRARGIAWCVTLLLIGIQSLSAQLDRLPSRRELDSLVRPSLSTTAQRGVAAKKPTINLEEIDGREIIRVQFTLHNTTSSPVVITQFRSMCSCLKVLTRPTTLRPNESLNVEVEFNPAGRTSKFSTQVFVYTSLDAKYPPERLTLSGTVHSTNRYPHLAQRAGELYMSRKSVSLTDVKVGKTRREIITVANGSDTAMTLSAKPLINGLEFSVTPATLKPGEEGEIVISYTPKEPLKRNIETMLIIEGCDGKPSERTIKVIIKE